MVAGESPTVDVTTTRFRGTFNDTALQDVPSATDMRSILAESPYLEDVAKNHTDNVTLVD